MGDNQELRAIELFIKENCLHLDVVCEDLPHKVVERITKFKPDFIITGNVFQARSYAFQFAEFVNSLNPCPELYLYTTEIPDGVEKYFNSDHVIDKLNTNNTLQNLLIELANKS